MPNLNDFTAVAKEYGFKKDDWYRPTTGESKVRVLSGEFEVLAKHWIQSLKKTFVCYGQDEGCPYDTEIVDQTTGKKRMVHKPGVKYLFWVIDRVDEKIKIGELPYTVAQKIAELKSSEEYGFETSPAYDIIIKKTKTGPNSTDVEYTVIPSRKDTPLTPDEIKGFEEKESLVDIVEKMKSKEKNKQSSIPVAVDGNAEEEDILK